MDFKNLFKEYYVALENLYVDKVEDNGDHSLIYSDIIDDGIWNFVFNFKADNIGDFEEVFKKSRDEFEKRIPRFYILASEPMFRWLEFFKNKYNLYCKDSWFVTKLSELNFEFESKLNLKIEISDNKDEVIETIMNGFSTHDPNDPYGDLSPTYKECLYKKFGVSKNGYKTIHYVAKFNNSAIGMGTVTYKGNNAFLNNITTLKKYKGNGVAKELLTFIRNDLKNRKIGQIIFATETGAYTENFYKKLGFKIANYGYCFE